MKSGDGETWTLVRTPSHSQVEYMAIKVQYPFGGALIILHRLTFWHQGELPN